MGRPKEHMDLPTFEKALEWVEFFNDRGTQNELSFTGLGESTLNPLFPYMLKIARKKFPKLRMVFSTNGLPTFTEEIAKICQDNNILVAISLHRPEVAGRAIELAKKYDILELVNASAAVAAFDWAGQVDWFVSAPDILCDYLKQGWGVILFDGKITTCCLDANNYGVVGTIYDKLGVLEIKPYSLCESCHMRVP
jgi:hypothetical protein